MKIKFLKDYRYPGGGYSNKGDVRTFEDAEFAKWAIDNGFAEEVKESGWWKLKLGDIYYIVHPDGLIVPCTWDGCTVDENRFFNGAGFKTREAVERWRDYLQAVATVRQDEGVMTPEEVIHAADAGIIIGRIIVRDRARNLEASICNFSSAYPCVGTIYFDTCEHARASLDNHPDEWKIIANYDWSRG